MDGDEWRGCVARYADLPARVDSGPTSILSVSLSVSLCLSLALHHRLLLPDSEAPLEKTEAWAQTLVRPF